MTRNPGWHADGVEAFPSLETALASRAADDEIMVIGGGELYALTLPLAERLYLTEVHRAYEGDAHFPAIDATQWKEISRTRHSGDPDFSWVLLER